MKKNKKNVAIIGCGTMGGGIAHRLSPQHEVYLYDHNPKKMESLKKAGCGIPCQNLQEALKKSEIVILAIKPQEIKEFSQSFDPKILKHTIISILSGTTLGLLQKYFPGQVIIRLMPNIALLNGESTNGLAADASLPKTIRKEVESLCDPLGKNFWLPESKFNGFTSLAGSGIAFVFALIESMVEAGIAMGLTADESLSIVNQMIKGSVGMLEKGDKHPAQLKWQVCSPGGTTIAGLRKFEESGVPAGILNTFLAAYQRAIEQASST